MPTIFVSHASTDDATADSLRDWLTQHGFLDVFIDHHDIRPGEKWADRLRASAGACRVVLCVVSERWLGSPECFNEFLAGWYMGKRMIPLFLADPDAPGDAETTDRWNRVRAEDQGLDIRPLQTGDRLDFTRNEALSAQLRDALRAAGALSGVGLDPEVFEIDEARRESPFPGLAAFGDDDADAGLFYGRSREIAACLEELRKMRVEGDARPLMILGASGSGKSSLLKAGIIPRLRREAPAWIPLRAFRPGADPLFNFAEAIARTLADFDAREASGTIQETLLAAWRSAPRKGGEPTEAGWEALEEVLEAQGATLRGKAGRSSGSILIGVDQAEELARAEGESGQALADYLRVALQSTKSDWHLAFTIRTDSFPELQRHPRFQDLEARGYDLRALPVFRFDNVVTGPARRCGVQIDPDLIDRLMEDAPQSDALPLLAFAMQRLWRRFRDAGRITLRNYEGLGGLSGMIEDAAERALRGMSPLDDAPLPRREPSARVLKLGAETFVPPLAQVNDDGEAIRRVAVWSEFSDEAQELLEHFDLWRLVVRKGGAQPGKETLEVAHEALFREWIRLKEWLEPQRARLETLRELEGAAAVWDRRGREGAYIAHLGPRLAEAKALKAEPQFAARLTEIDTAYLDASQAAQHRRRRDRRLTRVGLGTLAVLSGLAGAGFLFKDDVERWVFNLWQLDLTPVADLTGRPDGYLFTDCSPGVPCPELVIVPSGDFMMGSPSGEGQPDEYPRHPVTIGYRMAVARTEITFDAWNLCVEYGGDCSPKNDYGWGEGQRPVVDVSWDDAQAYIAWLNKSLGLGPEDRSRYRLLTEAEWEYAARAGTPARWHFGDDPAALDTYAWFDDNSDWQTHPVRGKDPNDFGLYDMHGNVWEWTEDCWHGDYTNAPPDGSAWMKPDDGDCSLAVLRGGSWSNPAELLRSAYRNGNLRDFRYDSFGFRVVRTLGER